MSNPNLDVQRARADTPGCSDVVHFDNAGASLMPQPVLDATVGHLQLESRVGGYEAAARAGEALARVYDATGALIGCQRSEIAIVENATRAWDMAFYSIPFEPGDRILTSVAEYASNYIAFLQVAQRTGAVIDVIPNDEYGQVSLETLEDRVDRRARLIAITHVPTNGGLVNPAIAIGNIARRAGVLYLLDACQGATWWAFSFWAPAYLLRYDIAPDPDTAALALLPAIVGFVIGTILGGWMIDRLRHWSELSAVWVSLISMVGALAMSFVVFALRDLTAVLVTGFFLGLFGYMIMPAINVVMFDVVPPETRSSAVAADGAILSAFSAITAFSTRTTSPTAAT